MADFPQVQGAFASWANFKVRIKGTGVEFSTPDIASIEWKDSLEPGDVRGKGPGKRGRTEGDYDADAKLSLYRHAHKRFMQALKAAHPAGKAGLVEFDIFGHWEPYSEDNEAADLMEVRIVSCRVKERATTMAPGNEATAVDIPLSVMKLYEDGVCLIGDE